MKLTFFRLATEEDNEADNDEDYNKSDRSSNDTANFSCW